MPVLDNPALPQNVKFGDEPHHCQNRKRKSGYSVLVRRYFGDGTYVLEPEWILNRMSTTCRYDMSLADPGCLGCKEQGYGEAYAESVREGAK